MTTLHFGKARAPYLLLPVIPPKTGAWLPGARAAGTIAKSRPKR